MRLATNPSNKITEANAVRPRRLPVPTRWAARVAQFSRLDQSFMPRARAVTLTFASLLFFHSAFADSDGFSAIGCGDDVAKALIGKKMSNERVVDLEKRDE